MTKSHRELPWITGKLEGKETRFSTSPNRGFWQLASSFHSPLLFIPLIGLLSDLSLLAIPCLLSAAKNDPGGLAGCEQKLVNQDLEKRGRRSKTSCWMSDCMRVCAYVFVLQRGVVSVGSARHRSRLQRSPRKWGRNDSANSVQKTDRESDFGEFQHSHKGQVELKKGFLYIIPFWKIGQNLDREFVIITSGVWRLSHFHTLTTLHPGEKAN